VLNNSDQQLNEVVHIVTSYCRSHGCTPREAIANLGFINPGLLAAAVDRIDEIARGIVVGPREGVLTLVGDGRPQPWYVGPGRDDLYWPALRRHLAATGWDETNLDALDVSSTKVLANLANPTEKEVRTRGLVLGHVQSGKTTNFTAVISKAADAGYRMFIVLSGTSNALRRQTQIRLSEQLVSLNPLHWDGLTDESRDMGKPMQFGFAGLAQPGVRTLAVVKKNVKRLDYLAAFLAKARNSGALANCPILVIDDEADQASLSPVLTPEGRTAINNRIISILEDFPKVAYVAYTATPFANFFVDPAYPDNLYPRDFIISLPEPDAYFGARRMFGVSENDPPELDVVRYMPDEETRMVAPPRPPDPDFKPVLPPSVLDAIRWFLLASTARRLLAGGLQPHSTMMIHTSERVRQHRNLWTVVATELSRMREAIEAGEDDELRAFVDLWNSETSRVDPGRFGAELPTTADVIEGLGSTLYDLGDLTSPDAETCGLIIDNGSAGRRLLYDNDAPKPVIVIGGNTLSRGLTLEGLVSTVFARSANLYDTLLQMGRWFGYRRGYEALPRVWMPPASASQFAHLSRVELEIREEIERYADSEVTPMELAVRVRLHPAMEVTRAQMMRAVKRIRVGYSGAEVDTTYLLDDREWLDRNRRAAEGLARRCVAEGRREAIPPHVLFRGVPVEAIFDFLAADGGYRVQPAAGSRFTESGVRQYIESRVALGELSHWNVGFVGTGGGREVALCDGLVVTTSRRGMDPARTKGSVISLGDHITSEAHKALDLPPVPTRKVPRILRDEQEPREPLLLVYVVDKKSRAAARGVRQDLDIQEDFVGIGIGFPTSLHASDVGHVEVQLPDVPPDGADDDYEDEIDVDAEGDADDVGGRG
jgi:hypothetical protein